MTYKELVAQIATREGRKSQVKVGDIKEILSILADLNAEGTGALAVLEKLSESRAKKKAATKKVATNGKSKSKTSK